MTDVFTLLAQSVVGVEAEAEPKVQPSTQPRFAPESLTQKLPVDPAGAIEQGDETPVHRSAWVDPDHRQYQPPASRLAQPAVSLARTQKRYVILTKEGSASSLSTGVADSSQVQVDTSFLRGSGTFGAHHLTHAGADDQQYPPAIHEVAGEEVRHQHSQPHLQYVANTELDDQQYPPAIHDQADLPQYQPHIQHLADAELTRQQSEPRVQQVDHHTAEESQQISEDSAPPARATDVEIVIGRIEVRTAPTQRQERTPPPTPAQRVRPRPSVSLTEYLSRPSGGGRR